MERPTRILILEDLATDAELIQFELQEAGIAFTAKWVISETEYLQALQEFIPDLILSDYDLPRYNGAMAMAEARRRCPDTPFILVTGAIGEDRAIEILTHGAKDYVLKNRLQRLAPAVQRAIAEAAEQRARKEAEDGLREAHSILERQVAERTADLHKEIEKRRQIEATLIRYNERLELISYISERLHASDDPQQVVEELCLKVMEYLDCHAFFNFIADKDAGRLRLNAFAGIPPETSHDIEWLDYGVAVCGCVARDARRIVAENIPSTPDIRTDLIRSFGIKAYACHPLLEKNRVLGTLSFGSRSRTAFSADDLAMMQTVTDHVAVAMVRVRIEEELRKSESNQRRLMDSGIIGVVFSNVEGRITEANDAFLQIVGYTRDDLCAGLLRWIDMTPPEWLVFDHKAQAEARIHRKCTPYEKEYMRKDGSRVPVLIGWARLEGSDTESIAFVLSIMDPKREETDGRNN
jgi:PAS domain S-box-containing protein